MKRSRELELALRVVIFGGEALEAQSLQTLVSSGTGKQPRAGEHVWDHRDDGACERMQSSSDRR